MIKLISIERVEWRERNGMAVASEKLYASGIYQMHITFKMCLSFIKYKK